MHSLVGSTSAATSQQGDWLLSLLLAWQRRSLCIQLHFCAAAAGVEKLQRQVQCAKENQGVTVKKQEKKYKKTGSHPKLIRGRATCVLSALNVSAQSSMHLQRGKAAWLSACVCVCVYLYVCVCVSIYVGVTVVALLIDFISCFTFIL